MKKLLGLAAVMSLVLVPALRASAMTNEEAAEKAIGLMEGIANIVDQDKADCDKMAADVNKYEDDNAALIKELGAMRAKRSEADKKAFQEKYKDRIKAAQQKTMAGGQACQSNEKVKAAFARLRQS